MVTRPAGGAPDERAEARWEVFWVAAPFALLAVATAMVLLRTGQPWPARLTTLDVVLRHRASAVDWAAGAVARLLRGAAVTDRSVAAARHHVRPVCYRDLRPGPVVPAEAVVVRRGRSDRWGAGDRQRPGGRAVRLGAAARLRHQRGVRQRDRVVHPLDSAAEPAPQASTGRAGRGARAAGRVRRGERRASGQAHRPGARGWCTGGGRGSPGRSTTPSRRA